MTVYNQASRRLDLAIKSILEQTFLDYELIIIDDKSEDNSTEIIQKYLSDKRIIFIQNKSNMGLSFSLNKALEVSNGEYIVINDADDLSVNNRLDIVNTLLNQKKIDVLGSAFYQIIDFPGNYNKSTYYEDFKLRKIKLWRVIIGPPFAHSTCFYRKISLTDIGGFDSNIKSSIDHITMLKLLNNGYKMYRIGIPLVLRYIDGKNFFMSNNKKLNFVESESYIKQWSKKNIPFYFLLKIPKIIYYKLKISIIDKKHKIK